MQYRSRSSRIAQINHNSINSANNSARLGEAQQKWQRVIKRISISLMRIGTPFRCIRVATTKTSTNSILIIAIIMVIAIATPRPTTCNQVVSFPQPRRSLPNVCNSEISRLKNSNSSSNSRILFKTAVEQLISQSTSEREGERRTIWDKISRQNKHKHTHRFCVLIDLLTSYSSPLFFST